MNKSKLPKEFEDVTGRYDEEEANIVCELCHQYDPPPDMNLPGKGNTITQIHIDGITWICNLNFKNSQVFILNGSAVIVSAGSMTSARENWSRGSPPGLGTFNLFSVCYLFRKTKNH